MVCYIKTYIHIFVPFIIFLYITYLYLHTNHMFRGKWPIASLQDALPTYNSQETFSWTKKLCVFQLIFYISNKLISTLQGINISPWCLAFLSQWFSELPQVGYVSLLEGICLPFQLVPLWSCLQSWHFPVQDSKVWKLYRRTWNYRSSPATFKRWNSDHI